MKKPPLPTQPGCHVRFKEKCNSIQEKPQGERERQWNDVQPNVYTYDEYATTSRVVKH